MLDYCRIGHIQFAGCLQHPGEIPVGIQLVFQSRLDHGKNNCTSGSPFGCIGKQEILAVNHKGLYTSFGTVVGDFQPAVPQIIQQVRPLFLQVSKGFPQGRLRCRCTGICPRQKSVQNRLFLFQSLQISFFRRQIAQGRFQFKQLAIAGVLRSHQRLQ